MKKDKSKNIYDDLIVNPVLINKLLELKKTNIVITLNGLCYDIGILIPRLMEEIERLRAEILTKDLLK